MATRTAFHAHHFTEELLSPDLAVNVNTRVSSGHKTFSTSSDDAMGFQTITGFEQHDVAHLQFCPIRTLHLQDVAILNRWPHAAAFRLETKARATRKKRMRKLREQGRINKVLTHGNGALSRPRYRLEESQNRSKERDPPRSARTRYTAPALPHCERVGRSAQTILPLPEL